MSDTRKDLPPANSVHFLERVREVLSTYLGVRGDPMDRALTVGDLADSGLVNVNPLWVKHGGKTPPISGPGEAIGSAYSADLMPPPTPSGFSASADGFSIHVRCSDPDYVQGHGHARSRLYGCTWEAGRPPVFSEARVLAEFHGKAVVHASSPETTWHLWLAWISMDGVESVTPAGGANGLATRTEAAEFSNLTVHGSIQAASGGFSESLGSVSITGESITGAFIATADHGKRIELTTSQDANGLSLFNKDNVKVVFVNANNGGLSSEAHISAGEVFVDAPALLLKVGTGISGMAGSAATAGTQGHIKFYELASTPSGTDLTTSRRTLAAVDGRLEYQSDGSNWQKIAYLSDINAAPGNSLSSMDDVDVTNKSNGSLLSYDSATSKWQPTNTPTNQVFDGGNF